jgi:hypothetical protein
MVDFHKRLRKKPATPLQEYRWSQTYALIWGLFCIVVAQFSYNLGNSLIEAVNILGSWFYGTILGIFLVAFYLKRVGGHAVFTGAILAEITVIVVYSFNLLSFLWLNVIGAVCVLVFAGLAHVILFSKNSKIQHQPALK